MVAEPGERFNACEYLLDRRVKAGDGGRLAITGAGGQFSYAELLQLVQRTAAGLREIGLEPEQRIVMFASDGPAFAAVYLAAMRIGAIPVPVSTMLRPSGLAELLRDSRARLLAVTPEFGDLAAEVRHFTSCVTGPLDVSVSEYSHLVLASRYVTSTELISVVCPSST